MLLSNQTKLIGPPNVQRAPEAAKATTKRDFTPLLMAALGRPRPDLIKQIADLIMINSSSRLGNPQIGLGRDPAWGLLRRLLGARTPALPAPDPAAPARSAGAGRSVPAPSASDEKLTPPAPRAPEPAQNPSRAYEHIIQGAARRYGLDPHLVRAVVTAESDFDPNCVSPAGAMGLMQLMPQTAQDLGVEDPYDPVQNIEGGARYLSQMLKRFGGDVSKALAAYNWGPSNVESGGRLPSETRNYLKKVARFRSLYARGFKAVA
jgi:soluble lytic murein transglycosylase-like protein